MNTLIEQINLKPGLQSEVGFGTMRYESNPWCLPTANRQLEVFNYKLTNHKPRKVYNQLEVNRILYEYSSSTPDSPLFRLYSIHLDNFQFVVYRQLSLDISPTLVGRYSNYTNAFKVCKP